MVGISVATRAAAGGWCPWGLDGVLRVQEWGRDRETRRAVPPVAERFYGPGAGAFSSGTSNQASHTGRMAGADEHVLISDAV